MSREDEYAVCLRHVVKFLYHESDGRPIQADYAERIGMMCRLVLWGDTTKEALEKIERGEKQPPSKEIK